MRVAKKEIKNKNGSSGDKRGRKIETPKEKRRERKTKEEGERQRKKVYTRQN